MKFRHELYILMGTGLLVLIVVIATSVNIDLKISGKNSKTAASDNNSNPPQAPQVDSMASHHGGSAADSKVFDAFVGKAAPDFTLEAYDGTKYTLSSLKGKNVILFFNEGLMCYPACWNQVAAFGSDAELQKKNTVVLNINVDPKGDWKQAIDKMPELAKATVLLDTDRTVSSAYGVLSLPSSMHRGQFPGHSYVIIDKEGIVRFARDDSQMAVRNKELLVEIDKFK